MKRFILQALIATSASALRSDESSIQEIAPEVSSTIENANNTIENTNSTIDNANSSIENANNTIDNTNSTIENANPKPREYVTTVQPPSHVEGLPIDLSNQGSVGLFAMIDLLYWQPSEGGTDFALPSTGTLGSSIISPPPPAPGATSPGHLKFQWEPGVRFGAGYHLPYDGWETSFTAAYLHSKASHQVSGILFPTQALAPSIDSPTALLIYATQASASASLNYWVFDYRVGCERTIQKSLLLVPYCGLRGSLIHQTFYTRYSGVLEADPAGGTDSRTYLINMTNNCNNVGIQGGLRGEWSLREGFRLFGDFATALVSGWFNVRQKQSGQLGFSNVLNYSSHFQRLLPALDMMLGLSWGRFFCKNSVHIEFHAAYQMQYWWNQNQTPRFISSTNPYYVLESDDLGLQGLTLGGSVEF